MKCFYWSPFLTPIATPRAVINSAYSLQKFSKKNYCSIINFFGEFNVYKKELENNQIQTVNLFENFIINNLPKYGKIKSRFSFILIFILSFFPLKNLIKKEEPDFLIVQLITSLPMTLLLFFKFRTKFILRISGLPKLNIFRKTLWKIALKNFHLVTCPTESTYNYIKSLNIIEPEKVKLLYDPVIEVNKIKKKIKEKNNFEFKNYFLAAGRLTKQKNFIFLCKAFQQVLAKYPDYKLLIAGEGEDGNKIKNYIIKHNLEKNIFLINYVDNIFPLIKDAEAFILSSLWEDPGFVIIEAAFCRKIVFSSNCLTGPREIIKNDHNGFLFESNNIKSFLQNFDKLIKKKKDKQILLNNLKYIKKFTLFNHYRALKELLII
jgi:glycosyltransferase involved in cell wall biosynthesis|tara:strand:- start:137 stop:1267 length:1131 start_codon:yes stop_codon:yes gene_type:complete